MTHQIHLFLGGPVTIPQIALVPEGLEIVHLTHLSLEGLMTPWTHRSSGGPVMTPLIWLLVLLIHCLDPKAVKPQRQPLAEFLHIRRGWDRLTRHSQRTANMSMTQTSLLREKSKQNPISMILKTLPPAVGNIIQTLHLGDIRVVCWTLPPTQATVGKPLTQIFLLHGKSRAQGTKILIQICHLHGIDLHTGALTLTCLHQGGHREPNLLIPICLHLEGVSHQERRPRTCILGRELGWC